MTKLGSLAAIALVLAVGLGCAPPVPLPPPTAEYPDPSGRLDVERIEAEVVAAINRVREETGLSPLTVDTQLVRAARVHAATMARLDTIAHTIPQAAEPTLIARVTTAGYSWTSLAENIAKGYMHSDSLVAGWMASAGHRRNILSSRYDETGIGIAVSHTGFVYACQVFAQAGYRPPPTPSQTTRRSVTSR